MRLLGSPMIRSLALHRCGWILPMVLAAGFASACAAQVATDDSAVLNSSDMPRLVVPQAIQIFAKKARQLDAEFRALLPGPQREAQWVGNDKCLGCHPTYGEDGADGLQTRYAQSREILMPRRRGCEGCHGPGSTHSEGRLGAILDPMRLGVRQLESLCLSCHRVGQLIGSAGAHFPGHSSGHVSCLSCHRVHRPSAFTREAPRPFTKRTDILGDVPAEPAEEGAPSAAPPGRKAQDPRDFLPRGSLRDEPNRLCISCHKGVEGQFRLRSRHPVRAEGLSPLVSNREGKMRCIDCHTSGKDHSDSPGPDALKAACQSCHPQTQGPFLFPHDGGSQELTQGCGTCHVPHGASNRHLLRQSGRSLCLSCHSDFTSGHFPGATCSTSGCHSDIHGSNRNQYLVR